MCEEHRDLLKAYREAVATFSGALEALETARATASRAKYQQMAQHVEEARLVSEKARIALAKHTAEHGCFPPVHKPQTAG
jgi:hypothetical protein